MDENTVCTKRCGPRNDTKISTFERRFSEGVQKLTPSYYLKNVAPKYQGEYIHPKLTIS